MWDSMVQDEGGLPDHPSRGVSTHPVGGSSTTDASFDSAASRMSQPALVNANNGSASTGLNPTASSSDTAGNGSSLGTNNGNTTLT